MYTTHLFVAVGPAVCLLAGCGEKAFTGKCSEVNDPELYEPDGDTTTSGACADLENCEWADEINCMKDERSALDLSQSGEKNFMRDEGLCQVRNQYFSFA